MRHFSMPQPHPRTEPTTESGSFSLLRRGDHHDFHPPGRRAEFEFGEHRGARLRRELVGAGAARQPAACGEAGAAAKDGRRPSTASGWQQRWDRIDAGSDRQDGRPSRAGRGRRSGSVRQTASQLTAVFETDHTRMISDVPTAFCGFCHLFPCISADSWAWRGCL